MRTSSANRETLAPLSRWVPYGSKMEDDLREKSAVLRGDGQPHRLDLDLTVRAHCQKVVSSNLTSAVTL
jgi:hypothetical protein